MCLKWKMYATAAEFTGWPTEVPKRGFKFLIPISAQLRADGEPQNMNCYRAFELGRYAYLGHKATF